MPAYVIVEIGIRDREAYERYKQMAAPTVAAYGGRYLVRGGATQTLEGSWAPSRFVILEFPTADAGRAWWSSPEYQPAKELRQACADTEMLLVEGVLHQSHGGLMSKREDARIAKLAKKNAEKVVPPKRDRSHQFDPTLRQKPSEEEPETERFFKEMKRREF